MPKQEKYIQVGVTALRDPATGEFLPAVPLYIKAEDGAEEAEEKLIEDIGKLDGRAYPAIQGRMQGRQRFDLRKKVFQEWPCA